MGGVVKKAQEVVSPVLSAVNIFSGKGKESLLPGDRPRFTHRTKEEHEAMYMKQKNILTILLNLV